MRVNSLWIVFALPMVFDHVLNDSGTCEASLRAIAAIVLGVVDVTTHGWCLLTACGVWCCVMAAGLSAVVGDNLIVCFV